VAIGARIWCAWSLGLVGAACALVWLRARGRISAHVFAVAATVIVTADLFALGWRFHAMVPREQVFPVVPELALVQSDPGLFRVAGIGDALLPDTALAYGLQDLRGYDGMTPQRHADLVGIAHQGEDFRVVRAEDSSAILDLMNVKYIFGDAKARLPVDHFTRVWSIPGSSVFRNDRALPRAFLARRFRVATDAQARRLIGSAQLDLRHEVLLATQPPGEDQPDASTGIEEGSAKVTRYEDARVEILTQAQARRLLVLSDLFYPGWKAAIDDTPAPIARADLSLRAVSVPPGGHRVVFTFEPWSVRLGGLVSVAGALAIAALASRRGGPRRACG